MRSIAYRFLNKRIAPKLTAVRNAHPKRFYLDRRHVFFPRRFVGDRKIDLFGKIHMRIDMFPPTEVKPWLDRPDRDRQIDRRLRAGLLTEDDARMCRSFAEQGYCIARGLIPERLVDRAFTHYDRAVEGGRIVLNGERRFANPHFEVGAVDDLIRHRRILRIARMLLDEPLIPFQSIGSHWGSQQRAHSDAIHMTTYPLGYLLAAWVACEYIRDGSGPLYYYPGSHRLPYYLSGDVGFHPQEYFSRGRKAVYTDMYEPFIGNLVHELGLEPETFAARKGDVLFWHHNLLHGGHTITDGSVTRKAFVFHYFARNAYRFHELFGGHADIRF